MIKKMVKKGGPIYLSIILALMISMLSIPTFAATIVNPVYSTAFRMKTTVDTSSGHLNVRSGPGTNYDIIGELSKGDTVKVRGYNDYEEPDWAYITYPQTGWVKMSYLGPDWEYCE
jgi:uncharacterized protein YraI